MSCPLSSLHKYRGRWNIRTPLQILILILVYPPERQEEKIVQKAGQRGRAHAFGLASNNRNGFLTCKLKRELGTRVHIPVRYDSRVWVQQTRCQRNSDYTRKSGAVRRASSDPWGEGCSGGPFRPLRRMLSRHAAQT